MKLYTKILLALVFGAAIGVAANAYDLGWLQVAIVAAKPVGDVFIRLITMVVLPLVASSLVAGTASLSDAQRIGKIGARTLGFSVVATVAASSVGLLAFHLINPGSRLDPAIRDRMSAEFSGQVQNASAGAGAIVQTLVAIIPQNPFRALSELDLLAVVFFSVAFGAATGTLRDDRKRPVIAFFDGVNDASIVMIDWFMRLAPYGVLALSANAFVTFGADLIGSLLLFCIAVVLGELLHVGGVLALVIRWVVGLNPVTFYRKISRAALVAFSTSSSNATLPVSIEAAESELGISRKIAGFVLPLSATLNKAGSALYKVVAVMFIAQVYGFEMSVSRQLIVVVAATASAIAGAGVPGSGMVTILIVLNAVGMSTQAQAGVALVVGVDRLLDMIRTTVNVTGQMVGVSYVARADGEVLSGQTDPSRRRARKTGQKPVGFPPKGLDVVNDRVPSKSETTNS